MRVRFERLVKKTEKEKLAISASARGDMFNQEKKKKKKKKKTKRRNNH